MKSRMIRTSSRGAIIAALVLNVLMTGASYGRPGSGNLVSDTTNPGPGTGLSGAGKGPSPVMLGKAGEYAILAKTGISTTGTTSITGNIGASPVAASYITGFSLNAPPSTYSTSATVIGKVYASDYDSPTPANLTTAVEDMMTAYTDAASRAPDYTELGAGDIGGMTLAPAVYKWSTDLLIPSDLTLSGGPYDVWIFQIAGNLTQNSGVKITLHGGALPKNIFWQVAGAATHETTTHFEGILLSQTAIILKTGATVNGRLLAQTAVVLDANTVVQPDMSEAQGAAVISGVVTSGGSTPVAGAKIVLLSGETRIDSTTSDSLGAYALTQVGVGAKQVQAAKAGFGTLTSQVSITSPTQTATVNFSFASAATLTVTVKKSKDGALLPGATLVLWRGSFRVESVKVDSTAKYMFDHLTAADNYSVTASAPDYFPTTATVAVIAGTPKSVTLQLVLKVPGKLKGTVKDKADKPIVNALVLLRRGSATGAILDSARTNASGAYVFDSIVPGTPNYWITVISANGTSTRENIIVASGATVLVDFNFAVTSIDPLLASGARGIRIVRSGSGLALDLGLSPFSRTVSIFGTSGSLKHRLVVPAGESKATVPASLAPVNGFLYQVK
ncbi:MAG: hypothetical protein JWP91_3634 [Fibrobacteres bacterium]|nr:hypothetical protein [Fibrobacterota bacterium]